MTSRHANRTSESTCVCVCGGGEEDPPPCTPPPDPVHDRAFDERFENSIMSSTEIGWNELSFGAINFYY